MASLRDLETRLKDLFNQGFNKYPKQVQPQQNLMSQFGNSSVGKSIVGFQKGIEQRTLPKVNLQQHTQNIKTPVPRIAAQFGAAIGEDLVNLPQRLLEGGGRIGMNVRTMQQGGNVSPQRWIGSAASAALPLLDIATLGGGTVVKGIGKQAVKEGGKMALKQAVKRGALQGAAMGGIYGGLRGAAEGDEANLKNVLMQGAGGLAIGGVVGGAAAGVGGLIGMTKRSPAIDKQLRDADGRYRAGDTPIKPKGMPQAQWDFQLKFNKKNNRSPYKPVYQEDLNKDIQNELEKRSAGLTIRDINKDKNPLSSKSFEAPYKRGDITQLEKEIDRLLGTETYVMSKKHQAIPAARQMAKDALDDAANSGDRKAQEHLAAIQNLEADIDMARKLKTNPTGLDTSKDLRVAQSSGDISLIRKQVKPGSYTNVRSIDNRLSTGESAPFPWEVNQTLKTNKGVQSQPKIKISGQEKSKPLLSSQLSDPLETLSRNVSQDQNKIKLPTDISSVRRAETNAIIGNAGKGGVEGFDNKTRDAFQDWVNNRHATKVEGFLKNKKFSNLDKQGIEGFFRVQAGDKTGSLSKVRDYFDKKYASLKAEGINFRYQEDYLPQQWDNSDAEIQQVFGRSLGTKPSFTLEKIIEDYKTGIAAGLKPKFTTVGQLVGWYEERANKAIADKKFFDYVAKEGMLQPAHTAPREWVTIDPDRFPKVKVNIDDTDYVGTYKAPAELAEKINNYLGNPNASLQRVADYVSRVKNIALNFGIPGTAINAHGINIMARHTLFGTGSNPVNRFITATKYMIHPQSAEKYLDKELQRAPAAVKNGLTMSAEDYTGIGKQAENLAGQFNKKWEDLFGTPLFNKMLPALKLSSYEELVKNGMKPKEAAKLANNVYGGINWEQMGRNRDIQNMLRAIILAPDWGETTVKLGGNFAKALNPLHKSEVVNRYRTMMATFVASYIAMNIANKLTSGHYSYENEGSHAFELEAGYTEDGEKRYIKPYGTALDMMRIPFDTVKALKEGDVSTLAKTFRNRLSIPAGVAIGAVTDTDYRGNKIGYGGKDRYGNPMDIKDRAVNIGSEAMSLVGFPSFLKQFGATATGQQGLEQGITQGFELPFRYSNSGNSTVQKQVKFIADQKGLKGEDLYNFNQNLKGQTKFGDNQFEFIKRGGEDALNQILGSRADNKAKKEGKIASSDPSVSSSVDNNNPSSKTYKIGGIDTQGYISGNKFIYKDSSGKIQSRLRSDVERSESKHEKGVLEAQFSLATDRLKRNKDYEGLSTLNKEYINYLKEYQTKLDKDKDAKEILSVQNKIEDLEAAVSKGSGKKAKKGAKITIGKVRASKVKLAALKKNSIKTVKIRKAPIRTASIKKKTLKITTPSAKISYKIVGPSKIKGLTNSIKLA